MGALPLVWRCTASRPRCRRVRHIWMTAPFSRSISTRRTGTGPASTGELRGSSTSAGAPGPLPRASATSWHRLDSGGAAGPRARCCGSGPRSATCSPRSSRRSRNGIVSVAPERSGPGKPDMATPDPVMKVLSVTVGRPRSVEWRREMVHTAIHKAPVVGRVTVTRLNLDGDHQADLAVHGGPDKAVYVYPNEHYPLWRQELPDAELEWGSFGENLTTEGLLESTERIGDRLRIGTTELVVTQPRMPCYKLGVRFRRADMVKRFLRSGRTGFYLAVLREGEVTRGDSIEFTDRSDHDVTVADIGALYTHDADNQDLLRRAV